jgi:transposase
MWTHENRPKYNRDHLRYPSELTDDELAYVEPLIPPAKPSGGKLRTDMHCAHPGHSRSVLSEPLWKSRGVT